MRVETVDDINALQERVMTALYNRTAASTEAFVAEVVWALARLRTDRRPGLVRIDELGAAVEAAARNYYASMSLVVPKVPQS